MFEKLKSYCDSFLDLGVAGFDLIVYRKGECVLRYMNGYSDLKNKIKMKGDEIYTIYSCSKPITCTAAMMLWEKGLFSLEDKLSDYMPEFKEMTVQTEDGIKTAEKPILIKHLFEMSAGFGYDCSSPQLLKAKEETDGKCPTRETMKYLAKEPLLFEPGERWNYSFCHDVLGALIEVISGEKFEDFIKKNIFDVCGMNNSTFLLPDENEDIIVPKYIYSDGKTVEISKKISYKLGSEFVSGGAGGISKVDDYIKFLEALRTYKLLKPETVKLMSTNRFREEQLGTCWIKEFYGYGLGVRCPKGVEDVVDFGWDGAAGAYQAIDIENEISIYLGAHTLKTRSSNLHNMIHRFVVAEMLDNSKFEGIYKDLKEIYNYNVTY